MLVQSALFAKCRVIWSVRVMKVKGLNQAVDEFVSGRRFEEGAFEITILVKQSRCRDRGRQERGR